MKKPPSPSKKRSRAVNCLALYLLFMFGVASARSNGARGDGIAYLAGLYAAPLACLALGTWFAFRDRRRGAQVVASLLVVLNLGSLVWGFRQAASDRATGRAVQSEIDAMRAGVLEDVAFEGTPRELANRQNERLQQTASRLEASDAEDAAMLGRAMRVVADLVEGPDLDFARVMEDVASARFLDVVYIAENDDMTWQRATADRYREAVTASLEFHRTLGQSAREALQRAGIPEDGIRGMVRGIDSTWPTKQAVFEAHGEVAESYLGLLAFLDEHADALVLDGQGGFDFATAEAGRTYDALIAELGAAEARLQAAIEAHQRAISRA